MKLSELKDEEALDALAEMVEPIAEIFSDKEIARAFKSGKPMQGVKPMLKNHKEAVMKILAASECVPVEDYHCNIITLPKQLIELLNDPIIQDLFPSQSQNKASELSGSASANTAGREK